MSGFNNTGVPYYAHPNTPAIRPRPPVITEPAEWRAKRMAAYNYVRSFIRENWKPGDRFFFTEEAKESGDKSIHGGKTGTFVELKFIGNCWWVNLIWDDPDYKPNTGKRAGMFDFYHFAFKAE